MGQRRRRTILGIAMAAVGAVVAARPAAAQPGPAAAQPATRPAVSDVATDLRNLRAALLNAETPQDAREEAAARLVSRGSVSSNDILLEAMTAAADDLRVAVNRRLAVARALADEPAPPEMFISPLADALRFGAEQRSLMLVEAAAQALANFRRSAAALDQLVRFATDAQQPTDARVRAVRALGRVVEPASADVLVRLLRNERAALRAAAADALADLTGIREFGPDPNRWAQWQRNNMPVAGLNIDKWRADLLDARAARLDRTRRRHEELVNSLYDELFERYQAAPREQRAALLLSALSSREPDQRANAARLVPTAFRNGDPINEAVYERLIAMVGDGDADVREQVAVTLRNLNHRPALGALLTQLSQERDERVKVALAEALAPIEDPAAAPQLVALLRDPSPRVVAAAAAAIARTGRDLRRTNPRLADDAVERLRAIFAVRTPGSEPLRAAALEALAAVKDPRLLELVQVVLNQPDPSVQVRQAAVRAVGALGEPEGADILVNVLRPGGAEREPLVKLAALDALARIGRLVEHGGLLRELMGPRELDEGVRTRAWEVYQSLIPRAGVGELNNERQNFKGDAARQAALLEEMCNKLKDARDAQGQVDLAQFRVALGDTYMQHVPPLPDRAVPHYRRALDYFFASGALEAVTTPLIEKLIDAHLKTRNFTQAVRFAEEIIGRNPTYRDIVGPPIKNLADELRSKEETRGAALELIDAAVKMNPPLDERHLNELRQFREQLRPADGAGN